MGVIVRVCCCGCDLRTGVMIIGILYIISQSYSIYSNINGAQALDSIKPNIKTSDAIPQDVKNNIDGIIKLEYVAAAFCGVDILMNIFLLIAANVRSRLLCFMWCAWRVLFVMMSLGFFIFLVSLWTHYFVVTAAYTVGALLAIYFVIVVYSYAELIREEDQQMQVPITQQSQNQFGQPGPPPYTKMV